jgi:hypothetical protein
MFVVTEQARQRQNAAVVAKAAGPLTTMSEHSDFQGPLASAPGVTLRSDTTGAPIGSSFNDHAAGMTVEVQQAGYAEAADRDHLLQQTGQRRPSGLPGQPAGHVAPTGVGARFRQNTPQAATLGGRRTCRVRSAVRTDAHHGRGDRRPL